jgi:hypothetical protein
MLSTNGNPVISFTKVQRGSPRHLRLVATKSYGEPFSLACPARSHPGQALGRVQDRFGSKTSLPSHGVTLKTPTSCLEAWDDVLLPEKW